MKGGVYRMLTLAVTFAGSVSPEGLPSQQISLLVDTVMVRVSPNAVNDTGEAASTVMIESSISVNHGRG